MTKQPNLVYILSDDQRGDHLRSAGHPVLETPRLDRLAREGTRFSQAFCTSAICTPSRVCHYLGQWERRHGVNFNSGTAVSPAAWAQSFPALLREAGYFTGWVGKNHVPAGQGGYGSGFFETQFDYWYGNHGHSGFYPKTQVWPAGAGLIYDNAQADTQVEIFAEGVKNFLLPERDFLRRCRRPLPERPADRPFCLCVTFNLPHCYSTGKMEQRAGDDELYRSAYRDRLNDLPLPATYVPFAEAPLRLPREVWNGVWIDSYHWIKTEATLRERMVRTCQVVTGMDRFIGNLRTWLAEAGVTDNTILVFSTDHGLLFGEHGLGGKVLPYEECIRIPLVVYDPRLPASARGQTRDELVVVEDLAPTVLDLAGLPAPPTMQGRSLRPLLEGRRPAWREEFFVENLFDAQNYPRCDGVRTREWKYLRYFRRRENPAWANRATRGTLDAYGETRLRSLRGETAVFEELYCLRDDPGETHNVTDDPGSSSVLQALRERTAALGLQALDAAEEALTVEGDR
jgi:arylsulfatase A-like enzyme